MITTQLRTSPESHENNTMIRAFLLFTLPLVLMVFSGSIAQPITGIQIDSVQTTCVSMRWVEFLPNGRGVAMIGCDSLWTWMFGSSPESHSVDSTYYKPDPPITFSADGRLAVIGWGVLGVIWDATVWNELRYVLGAGYCAISRDGTKMYGVLPPNTVNIYNTETGALIRSFNVPLSTGQYYGAMALSPDETRLAAVTAGSSLELHMIDLKESKLLWKRSWRIISTFAGEGLEFSPDNRRLLFRGSWDTVGGDGGFEIHAIELDAQDGDTMRHYRHTRLTWQARYSSDGKYIAAVGDNDSTIRIWNAVTGEHAGSIAAPNRPVRVSFSPDGNRLAALFPGGMARLYELSGFAGITTSAGNDLEDHLVSINPNPGNDDIAISFELMQAATVRLVIVDGLGREVGVVATGQYPRGRYTVTYDASTLPIAVHRCVLHTEGRSHSISLHVVR